MTDLRGGHRAKRLYALLNSSTSDSKNIDSRVAVLSAGCDAAGLTLKVVDEAAVDQTALPVPDAGDAVYTAARGALALEQQLLRPGVRSVYRRFPNPCVSQDNLLWGIVGERAGVPGPRTVWYGTDDPVRLRRYVEFLGGLPVVVKVAGGAAGDGLFRPADWGTLVSLCEFLCGRGLAFSLREFVPSAGCERLIVLGDEVVSAATKSNREGDFRSGAAGVTCHDDPAPEAAAAAVAAAHAANLNYAGVDVLTDERDGSPKVLEVNTPFDIGTAAPIHGQHVFDRFVAWLTTVEPLREEV